MLFARTAALIAMLLTGGCWAFTPRPSPYLPTPPSEELRARLGTVAVVYDPAPPAVRLHAPPGGWLEGLGFGTLRALPAILLVPLQGGVAGAAAGPIGVAAGLLVGAAIAAVYTPLSTHPLMR